MPNSLQNLQQTFIQSLKFSDKSEIFSHIKRHSTLSVNSQFVIYQQGISNRFQKTLATLYPVCERLVGQAFFSYICQESIYNTRETSPDLNLYGSQLADFIESFTPAQSLPYLADVARLEWAHHYAKLVVNNTPFNFKKLKQEEKTPENIIFRLPLHSTLLKTPYPVYRIWKMNQAETINNTLYLKPHQTYYFFIYTYEFHLYVAKLNSTEWEILASIKNQATLGELTSSLPHLNLDRYLPTFIQKHWLRI